VKLAWLVLRGFRRFEAADAQLFGNVIALVGPNEAGKSSILQALEHLNDTNAVDEADITRGLEIGPEEVVIRARFLLSDEDRLAISDIPDADKLRWFVINKRRDGSISTGVEPGMQLDLRDRKTAASMAGRLASIRWASEIELDERPLTDVVQDLGDRLLADRVLTEDDRSRLKSFANDITADEVSPPKSAREVAHRIEVILETSPTDHPRDRACNALFLRRPHFASYGDDDRSLQSEYDVSTLNVDDPPAALANIAMLAGMDLGSLKNAVVAKNYPRA
jgi:hypothetical protein